MAAKLRHTVIKNDQFQDEDTGRSIGIRGINISGSSKLPKAIHSSKEVCAEISFKDRPFPLEEAPEHFARLAYWGLTVIRLLVPWEALEPYASGEYDEEYIEYLTGLLKLFPKYGLQAIIDPHQDVWSRATGGSGNPIWTLDAAGLNPQNFLQTYAASNQFESKYEQKEADDRSMRWAGNYALLACSTMFTLFFGGRKYAPNCQVGEVNIQDYLVNSHLRAYQHLASRIVAEGLVGVVLGFESMNEVHSGFIGASDLDAPSAISVKSFHFQPSHLQAMQLGMGQSIEGISMDPANERAWKDKCIWLQHGVWELDGTFNREYFKNDPATGAKADFLKDFWFPYVRMFADAIHAVWKEAFIFIQPPFLMGIPNLTDIGVQDIPNAAFSPHWYDIDMMIKREISMTCVDFLGILQGKYKTQDDPCAMRVGRDSFRELCKEQVREIFDQGVKVFGQLPCVFTEFGTMFDLRDGASFLSGDYSQQVEGLDAYISAMDSVGAGFTLWNYTPENSHSEGDNWNCEDLSVYTQNHKDAPDETSDRLHLTSLDKGGRAISAFVRPYAKFIPGILSFQRFDLSSCSYHLRFQLEASLSKRCEIFLPTHHYHPGLPLLVQVSHGSWSLQLFPILSDGIAISPLSDAHSHPQLVTAPHLQYLIWDIPEDTPLHTHVTLNVACSTFA